MSSFKLFMTYKKRKTRMCSDEFIAGDGADGRPRRAVPAPLRERRRHRVAGGQGDGRRPRAPARLPPHLPGLGGGGGDQPRDPDRRDANCPGLRRASVHAPGAGADQAGAGPGPARVDGDLPAVPLLTEDEMERWGPLAKIGPPLRPAAGADREALWAGLAQGYVAAVASDHSPRPKALKEPGWKNIFHDDEGQRDPFRQPRRSRRSCRWSTARAWSSAASRSRGWRACWARTRRAFRALPPQGRDPGRRRRRPADLGSHGRRHDPRRRPPRHRRLDALRGLRPRAAPG